MSGYANGHAPGSSSRSIEEQASVLELLKQCADLVMRTNAILAMMAKQQAEIADCLAELKAKGDSERAL